MKCPGCGQDMRAAERFRLAHEPGDTAEDRASLDWLERQGVELGADVTVYRCNPCDETVATFSYGGGSGSKSGPSPGGVSSGSG